MEDILVPIAFFAMPALIVWAVSHYRYKSRAKLSDMVQSLIASGQTVDDKLLKSLTVAQKGPHADLRGGLISIAVGIGFTLMGRAIPEPEAGPIMAAIGSIPILIGLALIGFWFFVGRKQA